MHLRREVQYRGTRSGVRELRRGTNRLYGGGPAMIGCLNSACKLASGLVSRLTDGLLGQD